MKISTKTAVLGTNVCYISASYVTSKAFRDTKTSRNPKFFLFVGSEMCLFVAAQPPVSINAAIPFS
jgi:hypothetical protein